MLLAGAASAAEPQPAKLSYGANWLAEAEHGGFYQAAADGTCEKYGLDVTIVQGGPNSNSRLLMSSGKLDCFMGSTCSTRWTPSRRDCRRSPSPACFRPALAKLKEYGIVDSGDALKRGIGAMSDERMKSFYDLMAKAGVLPKGLDYKKSYTLQLDSKGVGLNFRPK